jgi:hypothetical protein
VQEFRNNLAHTLFYWWKLGGTNSLHYSAMILRSGCDAHACEDMMHMLMWYGAHDSY